MSVLHLLGTAGEGGAETYFVDLVTALAGAGVAQSAAIRSNPHRQAALSAAGVPTRVLRFGGPLDLLTTPLTRRFARRSGARLTLAWMNRAARHTPEGSWARVGRLGGYYNLKYYRGFDALVANTEDIADWIVAQGWPAGRVRCIPNFAAPAPDDGPVDRAGLDTPEGAPLLLAMGRLHEAKAHDVALEALVRLPDAFLWIAGAGPEEGRLKALTESLGLSPRVRFLGWRTDASALYRTADLCLFPSRYEPLGNVVIQAWAHGLPVVAAASTGPAALIRDGEDGRLVPVDDPIALADAARALLDDPAARARLAAAGLARVSREFSPDAVVAQWRDLFAEYGAG
ncbi:glycosyltransferase [Phenylobacterium sp.]|jgi:glycosyltransferase involved in cell wall biosynthesis|uniref:glycosyltransferase n=1 Tax=Phenylobacterium sp. TaxID=1871053 RepID=UPI0025D34923|nr:glycosyltransferase [Phenylobacterium sp.]MCA6287285.1 glycosyltransferase [Phenylobacterium sp.]MCA6289443.1 glycosyltransferase [Phenylobacterium sp.]MCA6311797.1 glycosyltransferase [Phenylobacterium sp.]MCA6324410.1 glycosyltransferase [Phenylobacterium sp.]MCA6338575.1 glycosyltransferase [Phenylobacterium sp.]